MTEMYLLNLLSFPMLATMPYGQQVVRRRDTDVYIPGSWNMTTTLSADTWTSADGGYGAYRG